MRNIILIGILSLFLKPFISNLGKLSDSDCVSVAPSGVSGFWEILPKIKKNAKDKKILCASSGCLASVAKDFDIHYIYSLAYFIKQNSISPEDCKNQFIKILSKQVKNIPKLSIVTMDLFGNCYETSAQNKTHLAQLLIETTDIPYFTTMNYGNRIDGVYCFYILDKCNIKIKHSFSLKVLLNLLNFNLTKLEVLNLYNYIQV